MKCATGIQPSPHNSPIYDWAKLLSMRRIKSRARVREKSAGRRDGTSASPRAAPRQAAPSLFPGRGFLPGQASIGEKRLGDSESRSRATTLSSPTHRAGAWHRFPSNFSRDIPRDEIREKLNIVYRARAPERRCDRPPTRPIVTRIVAVVLKNPALNGSATRRQLSR